MIKHVTNYGNIYMYFIHVNNKQQDTVETYNYYCYFYTHYIQIHGLQVSMGIHEARVLVGLGWEPVADGLHRAGWQHLPHLFWQPMPNPPRHPSVSNVSVYSEIKRRSHY